MKKKVFVLLLMAVMLSLAAFGGLVRASGPPTVPFHADCLTYPTRVGSGPGFIVLEIPSDCIGTHLGNSEWYADSVVDLTPLANGEPAIQTGTMYFTAANGAQLIGEFAGYALPNATGAFDYWGEYWITEGTGRFSGATGNGVYSGGADGQTGVGTALFEGTLTNP